MERQGRTGICCGNRNSGPSSPQAPAEPTGLLRGGTGALDCVRVYAPFEPLLTFAWPHCCRLHLDMGAKGEDCNRLR